MGGGGGGFTWTVASSTPVDLTRESVPSSVDGQRTRPRTKTIITVKNC